MELMGAMQCVFRLGGILGFWDHEGILILELWDSGIVGLGALKLWVKCTEEVGYIQRNLGMPHL